jgi:hypothetical protein
LTSPQAASRTASVVDLAIAGRQEMRFDVLAELRKALADGTA